jgi:hypothetical protein
MDRHTAHPRAGIVQHSFNQRPYHVDGKRADFASLASNRMDGKPADERGGIAKSSLECRATSLVSQVIHERNAGRPYFRTVVCCSRDERGDGSLAGVKKVREGLLTDGPDLGIEREIVLFVTRRHDLRLLRHDTTQQLRGIGDGEVAVNCHGSLSAGVPGLASARADIPAGPLGRGGEPFRSIVVGERIKRCPVGLPIVLRHRPLSRSCEPVWIRTANLASVRGQSSCSHAFAGQPAGLRNPFSELLFVQRLVLVNVQVANGLLL